MGTLREPTIEGFVDKLIEDNHIGALEIGDVQKTLERATDQMTSEEKVNFIKVLSNRVDAPASNLITPNGLNYAVFESAVKEVSKSIETKRIDKEKQSNKNNNEENLIQQMTAAEREKKEWEEKILENKKALDDTLESWFGNNKPVILDEDKDIIAENMAKIEEFEKKTKEYLNKGMKEEDAIKKAKEDCGITEEMWESAEMGFAMYSYVLNDAEKIRKETDCTQEEALNKRLQDGSVMSKMMGNEIDEIRKKYGISDAKMALLVGLNLKNEKMQEKRKNKNIAKLEETKDGDFVNLADIKLCVGKIEKSKLSEKKSRHVINKILGKEKLSPDEKQKRKDVYKELTDEYLATGATISEIYEKYRDSELLIGMDFYDVLDGVLKEVKPSKDTLSNRKNMKVLRKHEMECRVNELSMVELDKARENIPLEVRSGIMEEVNVRHLINYKNSEDKRNEKLLEFKKNIVEKRGINTEDKKWKEVKAATKNRNRKQRKKEEKTSEEVIKARNDVIKDRKEIIKIMNDEGISTEEAIKKYFTENPNALKNYSAQEQKEMFGEDKQGNEISNLFLEKQLGVQLDRDSKSIGMLALKIEKCKRKLEQLELTDSADIEIIDKMKEIENLTSKYHKIEKSMNKRLSITEEQKKNDIFANKEKSLAKEAIFKKYIESGKNAIDIFKEIEEEGNSYKFSFADVLSFIEDGGKGILAPNDLKKLIDNERSIYVASRKIEIYDRKKETKSESEESWGQYYNKKIEAQGNEISKREKIANSYKNKLARRLGVKKSDKLETIADLEVESGEQDVDVVKEQQESSDNNQIEISELKVEQIKTTSGIIPNVKAIAKKGRVTKTSLKEVFSKISRLNKEKSSISKATDGNRANDKDVEQDMV